MAREAASARRETGAEDWIADHQAFVLAYGGRLRDAVAMSHVAEDLAGQAGHRERAALFLAGAAEWEALVGNQKQARRDAAAAIALAKGREVEYGSAVALILAGQAKLTYREFLHFWKDADSDLALLHEARDEYAALR